MKESTNLHGCGWGKGGGVEVYGIGSLMTSSNGGGPKFQMVPGEEGLEKVKGGKDP